MGLGTYKQYLNQSPMLAPDGKRQVWGEADSQNLITIYSMTLPPGSKVKLTAELGATGAHIEVSLDGKAVVFADEIVTVDTGRQICKLDQQSLRAGAGFAK